MIATRTPREEMERNWRTEAPPPPENTAPPPRALNLNAVLDLGNMVFFTFRGRPYGIPSLSMTDGEQIMDCWLELQTLGTQVTKENIRPYYRTFRRLTALLWKNCRPVGKVRRFLYALGLHRNPFRKATEGELVQLALFMLSRRMTALTRWPATEDAQAPGTS